MVSPDAGGVYRAKKFREGLAHRFGLDAGLAMIIKQRAKANEVSGNYLPTGREYSAVPPFSPGRDIIHFESVLGYFVN